MTRLAPPLLALLAAAWPLLGAAATPETPETPAASVAPATSGTSAAPASPAPAEVSAPAEAPAPPPSSPWSTGTSLSGGRGLLRLEAPETLKPGVLAPSLASDWFSATDLLVAGDHHHGQRQDVILAYGVLEDLEVRVGWARTANDNDAFGHGAGHAGDPRLGATYLLPVELPVRLGVSGDLLFPTSWGGGGVDLGAPTLSVVAAASYDPLPELRVVADLGLRFDRSADGVPFGADALQRFDAAAGSGTSLVVGAGAGWSWRPLDELRVLPFAELGARLTFGGPLRHDPILLSAGAKLFALAEVVELRLAADVRLSGAPAVSSEQAGVPPWTVSAALAAHWDVPIPGFTPGHVTPPAVAASAPAGPAETFELSGLVIDATGRAPVPGAIIRVAGSSATLGTDGLGHFHSWPLPVGTGLVQLTIEASGYKPGRETLPRGKAGEVVELQVKLTPEGSNVPGLVRGSVRDAQTGKPLRASITLPSQPKAKVAVSPTGAFELTLEAGRYPIVIASPGYQTQTKDIEVVPGDTVILNVDLRPRRD